MNAPAAPDSSQELSSMTFPPITRTTLALYCGGSGDHNPIHVDIDFARQAGLDDVIAHGMLIKAYIGRAVTSVIDQSAIARFDTQFVAPVHIGDVIKVTVSKNETDLASDPDQPAILAEAMNNQGVTVARSKIWITTSPTR